ncbi:MAG: glycogen synthase GlgA [Gammaproteobacteria bacterium]|nr:glycogen synthase GlgA [Gammaproteobacteria bacterium]
MRLLFASSEVFPLAKTGGLADVSASLSRALAALGHEVRIALPAYPAARAALVESRKLGPVPGLSGATLVGGRLPGTELPVVLVDAPALFERPGGPYGDASGRDWPDNARRFHGFARALCAIALDRAGLGWRPELVHCNDWQTGLVPALLSREAARPATVFTIHNQAYQGLFDRVQFDALGLPDDWWAPDALEFYGGFSFLKAGLVFADQLTTVSPTYARQLLEPEHGCRLDGLLRHRRDDFSGILNGIDAEVWNPAADPYLASPYDRATVDAGKRANKAALQRELGLPEADKVPLLGLVGRLVEQKGIDLVVEVIDAWRDRPLQWVLLGGGEAAWERRLRALAAACPERVAVRIGYDEGLAHRIEAGADFFLMPSRFEPCGLNQMYSQRYGAIPVVHRTGGLADTVVDVFARHDSGSAATGLVFDEPTAVALAQALELGFSLYRNPAAWLALRSNAMAGDFSWRRSAEQYLGVYRRALAAGADPR